MINKKKNYNIFLYSICLLIIFSYFIGFYLDESSVGAGGYKGDITWILKNIDIFKFNELKDAIFHKDLFGNRPPLIYVLNKLFNPFFYDYEQYRVFVFIISLIAPYLIYLNLKKIIQMKIMDYCCFYQASYF